MAVVASLFRLFNSSVPDVQRIGRRIRPRNCKSVDSSILFDFIIKMVAKLLAGSLSLHLLTALARIREFHIFIKYLGFQILALTFHFTQLESK